MTMSEKKEMYFNRIQKVRSEIDSVYEDLKELDIDNKERIELLDEFGRMCEKYHRNYESFRKYMRVQHDY